MRSQCSETNGCVECFDHRHGPRPPVPTNEGWLELAALKNLYTGEIIGLAMGGRMTKKLVTDIVCAAYWRKKPPLAAREGVCGLGAYSGGLEHPFRRLGRVFRYSSTPFFELKAGYA